MTECLAYNPQNNFASVIENINRELREKGKFKDAYYFQGIPKGWSSVSRSFVVH